jgi:1-acyl-sn-glycerol-3-phosphate acyltransferase
VIVIANHVGFIDGPVVHGVIPRRSHFLITGGMFNSVLGPILTAAGQIKVDGSGREALGRALAVLKRGDVVGVFPEGTRGAGLAESVRGGAAWLAVQSGAPVVPVALLGTRLPGEQVNIWPRPRRRIVVSFGAPVHIALPDGTSGRARQNAAAEQVAEALRAQVADALDVWDIPLPEPVSREDEAI